MLKMYTFRQIKMQWSERTCCTQYTEITRHILEWVFCSLAIVEINIYPFQMRSILKFAPLYVMFIVLNLLALKASKFPTLWETKYIKMVYSRVLDKALNQVSIQYKLGSDHIQTIKHTE